MLVVMEVLRVCPTPYGMHVLARVKRRNILRITASPICLSMRIVKP
jgi:hypothetical protein